MAQPKHPRKRGGFERPYADPFVPVADKRVPSTRERKGGDAVPVARINVRKAELFARNIACLWISPTTL
uniref:Uncharacterized protein n=1 Tax=Mycena chlorophos TaxID=658473 RepID=A0ABQ0KW68_MYCCL|nr:predicted protein [Mycena chlorophos]